MGKTKKIPLYDIQLSKTAVNNAVKTLKSGWLSPGRNISDFEKGICKLLKCRYAAAVSSATTGLELTLYTLGSGPGCEVITSPFTMVATVEAILSSGCTPVFADIDPGTLNINPEDVIRKVNDNSFVIMPVDIAGLPADYSKLNAICDEHQLPLVSDSAHGIGSLYKNKSIPAQTDASVFSFHATKNLTCGEGGMVVSKHKKLVEIIRRISRHGMTAGSLERKKQKDSWWYDVPSFGFKANMSELHAAVGLGQLKKFKSEQAKREKIARRYFDNLKDFSEFIDVPVDPKEVTHGWHLFIIRLKLENFKIDRNKFIRVMAEKSVECGVHYRPVFELSYYREALGLSADDFPHAASAAERVVSLPIYPTLKLADVDYVCDAIKGIVKSCQ